MTHPKITIQLHLDFFVFYFQNDDQHAVLRIPQNLECKDETEFSNGRGFKALSM